MGRHTVIGGLGTIAPLRIRRGASGPQAKGISSMLDHQHTTERSKEEAKRLCMLDTHKSPMCSTLPIDLCPPQRGPTGPKPLETETEPDEQRVNKLARYLKCNPRAVMWYRYNDLPD